MVAVHMPPAALTGVLVAVFALLYAVNKVNLYLARRKFAQENGCKPLQNRYPLKDPFFGTDLLRANIRAAKQNKLLEAAEARFRKYGRTYGTQLVDMPAIATIDPENIKAVLALRFKDFALVRRKVLLGKLLGHGIFMTDGEAWAHSRALLRPNFNKDKLADIEAFERHLQYMFRAIPTDGRPVDLQELFFRLTIDSATEFLFGESVHSLRKAPASTGPTESDFTWAFNYAQQAGVERSRLGIFRFLRRDRDDDEACRICHEYVDRFVERAVRYREQLDLEKGDGKAAVAEETAAIVGEDAAGDDGDNEHRGKYFFLNELAKSTRDKLRIRTELMNILLAGRDTTASLLSNMFFQVAKRPDVWAKMQQEVEETLHGELPTYEQLRSLKYIKWCLNESLRTHPVVPGNSRVAVRDTVIPRGGGPDGNSPVFVKKGTVVLYSPWSMHRDERWYGADAAEYRPERWQTLRPGWEYLPFNGGPRICLGQQYALTEASYTVVRLVQTFKNIESRDPGPWEEGLTLTMASKNGCKVALS